MVVELGEVGVVFEVDVDALCEGPSDPFVPGFGDVAMVDHLAALSGGGGKAGIGTELMGIPEAGDITDFCDEEQCGVGADTGYGHEELGIMVSLGLGGDLGGDICDVFLQFFEEGKISVDVGEV